MNEGRLQTWCRAAGMAVTLWLAGYPLLSAIVGLLILAWSILLHLDARKATRKNQAPIDHPSMPEHHPRRN